MLTLSLPWQASPSVWRAALLLLLSSLSHWLALSPQELAVQALTVAAGLCLPRLLPGVPRAAVISLLFVGSAAAWVLLLVGPEAGAVIGVLLLGAWLRLVEGQDRRSLASVALLAVVLAALSLIASPSSWILLGLPPFAWLLVELLLLLSTEGEALPRPALARQAGRVLALSLPVTVALFVLFPRLSGSLLDIGFAVGLPVFVELRGEGERAPISTRLSLEETAARASGDGRVMIVEFKEHGKVPYHDGPPPAWRLYWRGPVFWRYDGSDWHARDGWDARSKQMRGRFNAKSWQRTVENKWRIADYEVNLFPHGGTWLYALDLPERVAPSSFLTRDFQLINMNPISEPLRYRLTSYLFYEVTQALKPSERALALELPEGENPRLAALAEALREQSADPRDLVNRALERFTDGYVYTTDYPALEGRHQIDRFYFDTRSGHAVHFAGSFVLLMRAAGIPARLVAGYRGGSFMDLTNIVTVRESDTYAWVEVWLEDVGGWVRVDPARPLSLPGWGSLGNGLDLSAGAAEEQDPATDAASAESLSPTEAERPVTEDGTATPPRTEASRDGDSSGSFDLAATAQRVWCDWVMGYGAREQVELYHGLDLGRATWKRLLLLCAAAVLLATAAGVLLLLVVDRLRRRRLERARDRPALLYDRFCKKLARAGVERRPWEGPRDLAQRLLRLDGRGGPSGQAAAELIERYISLRYAPPKPEQARLLAEFDRRVQRFRPARAGMTDSRKGFIDNSLTDAEKR